MLGGGFENAVSTLEKEMRDLARDLMRAPTERVEKGRIIERLLSWADSVAEPEINHRDAKGTEGQK